MQLHPHSETSIAFNRIVRSLLEPEIEKAQQLVIKDSKQMKIAIPIANNLLCPHFGHCEQFALFDVDSQSNTFGQKQMLIPPPHEPGILPQWLHQQGADVIITGGMGIRAQSLFKQNNIKVIVGAPTQAPEQLVEAYLNGTLQTGTNICDH